MEPIAQLREEYRQAVLDETSVLENPIAQFERWFEDAQQAELKEPNAMTLATVDARGYPHARIVLLKGIRDGDFVFYTNFQSAKGQELLAKPHAALVFSWLELERQVRIEGQVTQVEPHVADAYFGSRPRGSQLGAWASRQSQVIASRDVLEKALNDAAARFADAPVPRPPEWGGFRVTPTLVEFWQGRANRLHDRLRYTRVEQGFALERLSP